jgi:hypothetical protein
LPKSTQRANLWTPEKNAHLKQERGVGFEAVLFYIERGDLLDILQHPNQARYSGQRTFVVNIDDDAYLVSISEYQNFTQGSRGPAEAGSWASILHKYAAGHLVEKDV